MCLLTCHEGRPVLCVCCCPEHHLPGLSRQLLSQWQQVQQVQAHTHPAAVGQQVVAEGWEEGGQGGGGGTCKVGWRSGG